MLTQIVNVVVGGDIRSDKLAVLQMEIYDVGWIGECVFGVPALDCLF